MRGESRAPRLQRAADGRQTTCCECPSPSQERAGWAGVRGVPDPPDGPVCSPAGPRHRGRPSLSPGTAPPAPVLSARAAGTRLVSVGRELSRAMSPRGAGVGTLFLSWGRGVLPSKGSELRAAQGVGAAAVVSAGGVPDMPPLVLALVLEPSPPRAPSSCTPTLSPFSESFSEHPTRCVHGWAWGCRGSLPVPGRRPVARPASRAACGTWALGATPSFISSPTAAPRVAAPGGWPLRPCIFV